MASPGTTPMSVTDVYNAIKAQEANFPIPRPSATFTVGTFNALTGTFTYAVPAYSESNDTYDPDIQGGPLKPSPSLKSIGGLITAMNIVNVQLRFNITNRQGRDFVLSVPGFADVHAPAGQNFVTLDVGPVGGADFTLTCGGKTFESQLPVAINRPLVGAGAFAVPALPVAIVYAPPVDQNRKNTSTWSFGTTTGTSTTLISAEQSSAATPEPQFNYPKDLANLMTTASGVVKLIPGGTTVAAALGAIASLLPKLFGETDVTSSVGITSSNQSVLTLTISASEDVTTSAQSGGPGNGDLIYFLKNARLCWFTQGGPLQLALLGCDGIGSITAGFLKSQQSAQSGLGPATIQALLALDTFVSGGPQAQLPKPRFALIKTAEVNGGDWKYRLGYTFTQQDAKATIETKLTVTDMKEGWLSFLGIGPEQTGVTTVSSSFSKSTQNTAGSTITHLVDLVAAPMEIYSVQIYLDVIFGTFAYRLDVPLPKAVRVTGTVIDGAHKPIPFAEVTLVNNGREFVTRADAHGNYAFRSPSITPGKTVIRSGQMQNEIAFKGQPLTNVNGPSS